VVVSSSGGNALQLFGDGVSTQGTSTGYDLSAVIEADLTIALTIAEPSTFNVSNVLCAAGYIGSAMATVCAADGEAYGLSGCALPTCSRPASGTAGYFVGTSFTPHNFSGHSENLVVEVPAMSLDVDIGDKENSVTLAVERRTANCVVKLARVRAEHRSASPGPSWLRSDVVAGAGFVGLGGVHVAVEDDVAVLSGSGADPSVVFSSDALGTTHEAGGEERGCCAPRIWARGDLCVIRSRDVSSQNIHKHVNVKVILFHPRDRLVTSCFSKFAQLKSIF
jgi:hypothetical protein